MRHWRLCHGRRNSPGSVVSTVMDLAIASRKSTGPCVAASSIALLVLPWIWPFANGPSPAVLPWLVSAVCAVVFVLLAAWFRLDLVRSAAQACALDRLIPHRPVIQRHTVTLSCS